MMFLRKALAAFFLYATTFSLQAYPYQSSPPERRMTVDNGFFFENLRPTSYYEFHLNVLMFQGVTIDFIQNAAITYTPESSEFFAPFFGALLWGFYHYYFTIPSVNSLHALGKGFRQKASGLNFLYFAPAAKGGPDDSRRESLYFYFAWYNIAGMFQGTNRPSYAVAKGTHTFEQKTKRNTALIAMGGANAPVEFSEYISRDLYFHTAHFMHFSGYLAGKLYLYQYADLASNAERNGNENDLVYMKTFYRKKGISYKYRYAKEASLATIFTSATTYAFLRSLADRRRWTRGVEPLILNNYILPDAYYYLTTRGPSYRVSGGYQKQNFASLLSLETVQQGQKTYEAEFTSRIFSQSASAELSLLISSASRALGSRIALEYLLYASQKTTWRIYGSFTRYAYGSLLAERRMPSVRPQLIHNLEWTFGISIYY